MQQLSLLKKALDRKSQPMMENSLEEKLDEQFVDTSYQVSTESNKERWMEFQ